MVEEGTVRIEDVQPVLDGAQGQRPVGKGHHAIELAVAEGPVEGRILVHQAFFGQVFPDPVFFGGDLEAVFPADHAFYAVAGELFGGLHEFEGAPTLPFVEPFVEDRYDHFVVDLLEEHQVAGRQDLAHFLVVVEEDDGKGLKDHPAVAGEDMPDLFVSGGGHGEPGAQGGVSQEAVSIPFPVTELAVGSGEHAVVLVAGNRAHHLFFGQVIGAPVRTVIRQETRRIGKIHDSVAGLGDVPGLALGVVVGLVKGDDPRQFPARCGDG